MKIIFEKFCEAARLLRDIVLPAHCCGCSRGIDSGYWCAECRAGLDYIKPPHCAHCSQPFTGNIGSIFSCPNCGEHPMHFRYAVARVLSRGAIRDLIHDLKYKGKIWAAQPLAEIAIEALADVRLAGNPYTLVPVPLHPFRLRERGWNQAEIIAREISRKNGLPLENLLRRVRATETQTHFDRKHRVKNLHGAFEIHRESRYPERKILLIDDVFTTGSTLDECARTLVDAGYSPPDALTVARG